MQDAKAEAQKALQEIQATKKIAAGKAFIIQICRIASLMPQSYTEMRKGA